MELLLLLSCVFNCYANHQASYTFSISFKRNKLTARSKRNNNNYSYILAKYLSRNSWLSLPTKYYIDRSSLFKYNIQPLDERCTLPTPPAIQPRKAQRSFHRTASHDRIVGVLGYPKRRIAAQPAR